MRGLLLLGAAVVVEVFVLDTGVDTAATSKDDEDVLVAAAAEGCPSNVDADGVATVKGVDDLLEADEGSASAIVLVRFGDIQ